MNAEAVVQRQLDAYNARDLERFLAAYDEGIRMFRPPDVEPVLVGKEAVGRFYAAQRFSCAGLNAALLNRIILGNKVIDHERISGVREQPFEVVVVYEVSNGLIACTWSYAAD